MPVELEFGTKGFVSTIFVGRAAGDWWRDAVCAISIEYSKQPAQVLSSWICIFSSSLFTVLIFEEIHKYTPYAIDKKDRRLRATGRACKL